MNRKNNCFKILFSSLLLILSIVSIPISAYENLPSPTSYKYINDYVGIMSESESKSIISIGKELEDKTGAQAVVVIINSTDNVVIKDYALNLFRTWGIGQKGKDNGLLILVSIDDKKWSVEVGRGLEGAIPDALSNRVMDSIAKPSFIQGNFSKGIIESYSSFSDYIAKEYNVTLEKSLNVPLPNSTNKKTSNNFSIVFGVGGFIILLLLDLLLNRGRVSNTLIQLIFLSNINRRGPRGGGGGFGGGSGGGGFGGFGGGSSNGGGSSGGW